MKYIQLKEQNVFYISLSYASFTIQFHGHIALILYNLLCSIKIDRFRCNIFILSFSNIMFHVNKLYLKEILKPWHCYFWAKHTWSLLYECDRKPNDLSHWCIVVCLELLLKQKGYLWVITQHQLWSDIFTFWWD